MPPTVKLHETTDKIEVGRGVRQGDTISPKVFTAVLEYAMKSLSWENRGINIDGERLTHLFADNIVLVSHNIGDSKQMLEELVQASLKVGLRINTSKTQIMTNLVLTQNIRIGDADIKETHIYKYLGHEIQIGKNNQAHEIQRGIGLGWAAFGKLQETFKSDIPICLKRKVYEQCVLPAPDHNPIVGTLDVRLKKLKTKRPTTVDITKLRHLPKQSEVKDIVNQKLAAINTHDFGNSIEQDWDTLKNAIVAIEKEVIGPKETKKKKEWMTEEILRMMDRRRSYKNKDTSIQKIR
ncbi:uncharacterized protein LOC115885606 [Sitophilus oryzae]|uniref:Uncharacterized protein LOC115885606 n=1 Tax=Sitophilus oryzae TaxID=7048 RepID=A0A6J2Y995_SITOR|nr:uncharacterized protein LOC115885606 [Sitophilus oryzae]